MTRDLTFLEHKDTDSKGLHSLKSYWQFVMNMPLDERRVFLQQERVKNEETQLQLMVEAKKQDEELIRWMVSKAKSLMLDYENFKADAGSEKLMALAEQYATVAVQLKHRLYTIKDIRKQREKIQWEKKQLTQMTKQTTEPEQSSSR